MKPYCVVGLALFTAACGSDSDAFVGTWNYTSGTTVVTCGSNTETDELTGSEVFKEGVDADLVNVSNNGCNIDFDVDGDTATAPAGQTCSQTTSSGALVDMTLTTQTFVLSDDVLTMNAVADAVVTSGETSTNCTMTGSGTLKKVME